MSMNNLKSVVAIDGPAGSGKSTVAKLFAKKIGGIYIDTGAMYRALGLVISTLDIDVTKPELTIEENSMVAGVLVAIDFRYAVSEEILVEVDGVDLTQDIREHHVSSLASQVSKFPVVREYLGEFQRELPNDRLCVMEGRDIGTVIFPDAFMKVFLTASAQVRAKRRYDQLLANGETVNYEELLSDIKMRDQNDSTRVSAPLKKADDALSLDTSELNLLEVIEKLAEIYSECQGRLK